MEDPDLELDVKLMSRHNRIRRRIENIYNKRAEEFDSKREYDDYLEEREDIVFNLCEGVEVESTEAKVRAYEAANASSIAANIAKKALEARGPTQPPSTLDTAEEAEGVAMPQTYYAPANQLPPQPGPVAAQPPKKAAVKASRTELRAGGWDPDTPKIRTMQDALTSLVLSAN
eukprot:CAMPEP_0177753546 /NCGR_PEP_ID=MMETSP0491_2-20121128/1519_1 /TAXON_ID=63592 /ORGANISM="Tetraselmis chuii, Strain PLY429" /LENGTH=172 /DNA_ID=CAMNT_0019268841 /DNA_START=241 /DNA_END=759 /DNA_ORIENTATION=+